MDVWVVDISVVDILVSYKTNMSKTLCPFKNGHNGCGYIGTDLAITDMSI
jgi:hypothetical protein